MSDEILQEIHATIAPFIQKQDTKLRKAISFEQRLIATLRFLATGRSLDDLKISTAIFKICNIFSPIGHTLSDKICRRVRNSNMMADQNE